MQLSLSEILSNCSKISTTQGKVQYLQQHDSIPLRTILQWALDPRVEWTLPLGTPPYKPTQAVDQHGRLYQEMRMLQYFVKNGGQPELPALRRETLFVQLLESIDPDDAKLLCSVKDKKIPYKGITPKLINTAFPGLIRIEEKKKSVEA